MESAYVGNFHGPPVTTGRRRRTVAVEREFVVCKEVRTMAAFVPDAPAAVRLTAALVAGAFETVAVASFGTDFLELLAAVPRCAELLFFFFVVVVVAVPHKSTPDSSIAAMKFEKRRIISNAATRPSGSIGQAGLKQIAERPRL